MDGPNVIRMRSMVMEECDKEQLVMAGTNRRDSIPLEEAVPGNLTSTIPISSQLDMFQRVKSSTACT